MFWSISYFNPQNLDDHTINELHILLWVSSTVLSVIQNVELVTSYLLWEIEHEVCRLHTHLDALLQLQVMCSLPGPACHMHLDLLHNKL